MKDRYGSLAPEVQRSVVPEMKHRFEARSLSISAVTSEAKAGKAD